MNLTSENKKKKAAAVAERMSPRVESFFGIEIGCSQLQVCVDIFMSSREAAFVDI